MSRILVVDDNANVRKVIGSFLSMHSGWEICGVAENGLQAVERAAALRPDVIVMDLSMPVLDGLQATRLITMSQPAPPVLIFTIENLPQLEAEAHKAGARRVVSKTDGMPALAAAIEAVLADEPPQVSPHRGDGTSLPDARARQRIPLVEPIRISSIAIPTITESTTTQNASPRGVGVSTQRVWRLGDRVQIDFLGSGFSAEARVVYWRSFAASKFSMGVEFLSITGGAVREYTCHGYQCACGDRVTAFRFPSKAGSPPAGHKTVYCRNGHPREIRTDQLHLLERWTESGSAAPKSAVQSEKK